MNKYGFIKVCAASVYGKTADTVYNCTQIINTVKEAAEKGCSVIVFPELSITSYSCQDLFHIQNLKKAAILGLQKIKRETRDFPIVTIVGLPLAKDNNLYNCAAVLC
ncbi:MAG: NAD(+) synthase, partial [Spirochaetales bacterium]|nr:NAD(+) synthase [Spirochaetales bacterium]